MTQSQVLSIALVGLVSGCGILSNTSGGTSGGSCTPACNGDKTGCPMLGSNLSALDSLHAAAPLAQKILGATPRWMGVFEGLKITRSGLPSPDPDVVDVLGQQTKVYVSGWVFKYCAGMNDVAFGAGPQTSTAQQGCNDLNCDAMTDTAEPAIDSAAAIAAAFPAESGRRALQPGARRLGRQSARLVGEPAPVGDDGQGRRRHRRGRPLTPGSPAL